MPHARSGPLSSSSPHRRPTAKPWRPASAARGSASKAQPMLAKGFKFTGICGLISFFLTRSVPTTASSCVKC